jgi:squalene-hopene/tetraprenyl-beta-curcumene cyclase
LYFSVNYALFEGDVMKTIFSILVSVSLLFGTDKTYQKIDISLQKEVEHAVIRGLQWLYDQQEGDGSWNHYPAITALVLSSFMKSHPGVTLEDTVLARGYAYLTSCVQPDGGIYIDDLKTYNTALAIAAFRAARSLEFADLIINGQNHLIGAQYNEENGYSTDSLYYGGIGYGGTDKAPDLSNLQWALEALHEQQVSDDRSKTIQEAELQQSKSLFFSRAIKFLERTQNYQKTNDQPYATNDGGFMYRPGESKAGETRSYGGMTYAGLKSFIYAQVDKEDERVQAAFSWLAKHYDFSQNPGMENQGLYYYYVTAAKALNAFGDEIIADASGTKHQWRNDLAGQILKLQKTEGLWVNDNARWWENNPILVTAYCILALEEIAGLPDSISRNIHLFH